MLDGLVLDSSIWFVVKVFVLIGLSLYLVFSLVIVRQVRHMSSTIAVGFEAPLLAIVILHLMFAVGVFILAMVIL